MKRACVLKIARILLIVLLLVMVCNNIALAGGFDVKNTFNGTIDAEAQDAATSVQDVLIVALTAVRIAGMAIAIIILIVVGIKIMMAAPGERANIKQYATNYLIGAFILLGAAGIMGIVQNVAKTAFGN